MKRQTKFIDIFNTAEIIAIAWILVFTMSTTLGVLSSPLVREDMFILGLTNGFSVFALIVAGIGLVGARLESIHRRSREIGLRMAVGARPRDIFHMVIAQSVTQVLPPTIPGILLGYLTTPRIAKALDIPTQPSPEAAILALSAIFLFGLFAGLYPAWRASSMQPAQILRKNAGIR